MFTDGMPVFSIYGLAGVLEVVRSLLLIGLADRLRPLRLHGGRLFHGACAEELLPILNGGGDSAIQFSSSSSARLRRRRRHWTLDGKRGA